MVAIGTGPQNTSRNGSSTWQGGNVREIKFWWYRTVTRNNLLQVNSPGEV